MGAVAMWKQLTMMRQDSKVAQGRLPLLLTAAFLTAICGCSSGGKKLPQDPLFVRKQPLEVAAQAGPPQMVARSEVTMPTNPLAPSMASRSAADESPLPSAGIIANHHSLKPRPGSLSNFFPVEEPVRPRPFSGSDNPLLLP